MFSQYNVNDADDDGEWDGEQWDGLLESRLRVGTHQTALPAEVPQPQSRRRLLLSRRRNSGQISFSLFSQRIFWDTSVSD